MELVTLKIFNTEIEAEMLKVYLETNGIEAYVFGNIMANTFNLFNNTSEGVQLKVAENDFEKASELVIEFYNKDNQ
ncbi:hypothetical protein J2X97_003268 [Epilithonimonas hungarica]|uniref:putative signal transducing protein n=1 Tax=Epilithonimonas hungarica TaxID=454006 RepID=UPI0012C92670|nr:DUF2007 domain-containing protein [Epilithonimonas hungarica]MDP9957599.1 hypothetical protein [Epilithonimonas hungarica]MPT32399.1 hypothetical protein [Chryseobacterium sp.]